MGLFELEVERDTNPVDLLEQVASLNDWQFERINDEISMTVGGVWSDYDVSLSWMEEFEALHLACAFDLKITENRINEAVNLISQVNEQLLIGHFDLWREDGAVMFRQTLLLNGGADPTAEQLECLLTSALEACERYYQAFQYVVWAGKSSKEALDAVLFETHGNA
ncbi:YbjN domain-containing protein [Salaquimonas pukyongi]|uniref:YbjN domain-containing protein n=1 Tax=Salaquimonas pukyongi TaxID=2712698 RepID=UPI00096B7C50|nr:YbjN domain-containing protein [Salaquimonas pukyongi]